MSHTESGGFWNGASWFNVGPCRGELEQGFLGLDYSCARIKPGTLTTNVRARTSWASLPKKALEQEESNIHSQYTEAGTPQQNSCFEQKFATLYGKVRSTLNSTRITQGLCCKLWAECAAHVTNMENVIVRKANESSLYENSMGKRRTSRQILEFLAKWE